MKKTSVLITGATGFVGSNLAEFLTSQNFEVHIILRESSDKKYIQNLLKKLNLHFYDGSMNSIYHALQTAKPKVVFHLASLFIAEHKKEDVEPLIMSNVLFGTQLIEAMKEAQIKNIVNTGTTWQHFNCEAYNPVNLYAATKQSFEDILKFYSSAYGINVINLKLSDTYGHNDQRNKIIRLLINSAISKEKLLLSPGEQKLDLINITDVVKAFMIASDILLKSNSIIFKSYGITSGFPISLKNLVIKIETIIQMNISVTWGGRDYRAREVMEAWRPQAILPNWCPEVSLEEGIKKFLNS